MSILEWVLSGISTVISGLFVIVLTMGRYIFNDHVRKNEKALSEIWKEINETNKNVSVFYSRLSDAKTVLEDKITETQKDIREAQVRISNHHDKFQEITDTLIGLRKDISEGMDKLRASIDSLRERRNHE